MLMSIENKMKEIPFEHTNIQYINGSSLYNVYIITNEYLKIYFIYYISQSQVTGSILVMCSGAKHLWLLAYGVNNCLNSGLVDRWATV